MLGRDAPPALPGGPGGGDRIDGSAAAPRAVLERTVRTSLTAARVFAALAHEGAASVLWDPDGGEAFVGFAATEHGLLTPPSTGVGDLAAAIRRRLARSAVDSAVLGWWGALPYELGVAAAGLPVPEGDASPPSFVFVDRGLAFAPGGAVTLIVLDDAPDAARWLAATADRILALPPEPPEPERSSPRRWRWRHERSAYLALIAECQEAIRQGDAYQLCLTNAIVADADEPPDPLEVYRRLRALTPTAHCGVLRVRDTWLISASPEQFLTVDRSGRARTRPMKGTRPRSGDPARDRELAAQLLASGKERAENLMIVDLMRNDLSRVSQVGSVSVTELFGVESYGVSHQLVSTIESDLETDGIDAMLALFPPGSMTGAPKHAAMRILGGLEAGPRGDYSGVWGRISLDGSLDLAVVIRSVVIDSTGVRIGSGGGITALSDPDAEWDEVVLKARPMLLAIGADPDGA